MKCSFKKYRSLEKILGFSGAKNNLIASTVVEKNALFFIHLSQGKQIQILLAQANLTTNSNIRDSFKISFIQGK